MTETAKYDVIIIGAGAAGLSALSRLDRAGCRALCVEARDRTGGRIHTFHDPLSPLPIELGPEFIHGRPPEIWNLVRSAGLAIYDAADQAVHIRNGRIQRHEPAWEPVDQIMSEMQEAAARGLDESFADFLKRSPHPDDAKELSASFVEGFNAARKEVIGIHSLAKDQQAASKIDGDSSFRFVSGYDSIPLAIGAAVPDLASKLRLNTIVSAIDWRPGSVRLTTRSALTGDESKLEASQIILTVPLGVLQAGEPDAGAIKWSPVPSEILQSASALAFGQVFRVVFRFREAFWETESAFQNAGFLLSDEAVFPTWWTPLAVRAPLLTGWNAGPHADSLLGAPRTKVIEQAILSLARIINTQPTQLRGYLENVYFHDWHADPFARGAYSYVPAGKLPEREKLAVPVADTLYFAGEATELNGHSATVHGAIASGKRAAQQIIESPRQRQP